MRGRERRRGFGSALSAIATVAVMTACASSGSQPGTQARANAPGGKPGVDDNGVEAARVLPVGAVMFAKNGEPGARQPFAIPCE